MLDICSACIHIGQCAADKAGAAGFQAHYKIVPVTYLLTYLQSKEERSYSLQIAYILSNEHASS